MGLVHWKLMVIFGCIVNLIYQMPSKRYYQKHNICPDNNRGLHGDALIKMQQRGFVAMLWLSKLAFPKRKYTKRNSNQNIFWVINFIYFTHGLFYTCFVDLYFVFRILILFFITFCYDVLSVCDGSSAGYTHISIIFMVISNWFNNHFKHSRCLSSVIYTETVSASP